MELEKEKAERLLKAIFNGSEDENYPETELEKVSYAEYTALKAMENLVPAVQRLGRLHRLLLAAEKSEGLPDVITYDELCKALRHILLAENDITEISNMMRELYETMKPKPKTKTEAWG